MSTDLTTTNTQLATTDDTETEPIAADRATAEECRVVEVSKALEPAYQRASTLELSDAEVQALMEPFPDSAIEIRPHDGLIYLPHIEISNRLNKVFKPGKWAMIRRREWFSGGVMYGEYVLLIRGCYVGEAIGGHQYAANNAKVNYSDALESTRSEALRRIAGKTLSCGDQVWRPEYSRQWVSKYAEQRGNKWFRKEVANQSSQSPKGTQPPKTTLGISGPQWETLKSAAKSHGCSAQKILNFCGVAKPSEINAALFRDLLSRIESRDPALAMADQPNKLHTLLDEIEIELNNLGWDSKRAALQATAVGAVDGVASLTEGQAILMLAALRKQSTKAG